MKCEICGEDILVVQEQAYPTDDNGVPDFKRTSTCNTFLRCGCYDCEGFTDCPYYWEGGELKRKPPPPPGPFDDFISILSLDDIFNTPPLIDSLRGKG